MRFVWISENTAIISLYSIYWLAFITEMGCVHCAVRAESQISFGKSHAMAWVVSYVENVFLPILWFFRVSIIPPLLHTRLDLQVTVWRLCLVSEWGKTARMSEFTTSALRRKYSQTVVTLRIRFVIYCEFVFGGINERSGECGREMEIWC
jgi:hypothetical protein